MKKKATKKVSFEVSSGNIYEDLGFRDAGERYIKTLLSIMVAQLIEKRRLTQVQAAKILGTTQAKVSTVCTGKLKDISLEKLLEFLTRLDKDVEIRIKNKPSRRSMGEISVAV